MNMTSFWNEFEQVINKYDLLKHSFYQAWSKGELTRDDLRMYAAQYYSHVDAFPDYLARLETRLPEGKIKARLAEHRADEMGAGSVDGRSHSDLWLDFAKGMGADCDEVAAVESIEPIKNLIANFYDLAENGQPVEALAGFYAYESQVPRIAKEKALGLKKLYGADRDTYRYFSVHVTADVEHAKSWQELIEEEVEGQPQKMSLALAGAGKVAKGLWQVLDGIEEKRLGANKSCGQSSMPACV